MHFVSRHGVNAFALDGMIAADEPVHLTGAKRVSAGFGAWKTGKEDDHILLRGGRPIMGP